MKPTVIGHSAVSHLRACCAICGLHVSLLQDLKGIDETIKWSGAFSDEENILIHVFYNDQRIRKPVDMMCDSEMATILMVHNS